MITIKNLQKVVDQITVIDIESLKIKAGEIAALVGPVDSGIDILQDLLLGRARPTMGSIQLAGIDPSKERKLFSRSVGVLFTEENLYKRQSPRGNLKFFARLARLPKDRVNEVLEQLGLADDADNRVENLSSSLKRRLALGRAILHRPTVLLLVEPFAKCDQNTVELMSRILRHNAENGVSILIIAEDTTNLLKVCDVIHRLEHGKIVGTFRPEEEQAPTMPFMIPAKLEGKVALVDPVEILFVLAQDDRTFLQTADDRLPTQFTMTELEKRLSRSGFFRAHRGYLVNLQHVKEVIPYTRDSFTLRLKDEAKTEIPLSKTAARELRELLGY
ncbi:MAG: ATP-binding cassette domain-containing protein [Chloroflexi bacterium]|nr:ATP-binding cassette domain-containing protein [Chloroflexota bacterium]